MPTLLSALALPIPDEVEGFDFSPLLRGESIAEPSAAFLQGMGATAIFEDGHEWRALRSKQYTYATYLSDGSELLFDNLNDPYQMRNLVDDDDHADVLNDLRQALQQRMLSLNDTFETCTWYEQNWIRDRLILRSATMS